MVKNIFVSDDENKAANTIAGIATIIAIGMLYFINKPADIYGNIINIVIALIVGGIVYFIFNLINKRRSKKF